MLKKKSNLILFGIIFCALVLRLVGITHGFPFIFHPDEPTIIRSALGLRFNPNPKHFDWPHFYIYLNYFLYMAFSKFRDILGALKLRESVGILFPLMWDDKLIFYYLTRCFSAILGALTVIPVYLSAKALFNRKASLIAAFCMAFLPFHVWHSHYSLGDVPMVFLLSWGLYFSCLILNSPVLGLGPNFKPKNYILSGFFIGLAASTKYNGGLSAFMVPVAHFLGILGKRQTDGEKIKIVNFGGILALILSGLGAFVGFLVGTPYALFDYKTFSRTDGPQGAFWQFSNVGSVGFEQHIKVQFLKELFINVSSNMGWVVIPIYVLTLGYLVYRIIKKKIESDEIKLVFLYSISFYLFWYISGFKNTRAHYYFIFYPFAAVIFGFSVSKVYEWLNTKLNARLKFISLIFVFLICFPLVFFSARNSYAYFRGDTRNDMYVWLVSNINLGENIVYNDVKATDVLDHIGVDAEKGLDNLKNLDSAMVIVIDPENSEDFLTKNSTYLTKVASFSNYLRLGPNIDIFRYNTVKQ